MIPIDELASIVLGKDGDGLLAIVRAYLDASYDVKRSDYYVVAGFAAPSDVWKKIEKEWQEELAIWELDDFHLTDIYRCLGHERGTLCIGSFSNIMRKYKENYGFGIACELEFWNNTDTGYEHPYHFCLSTAFSVLKTQQSLERDDSDIALIVDQDFSPNETAQAIFDAHKKEYPNFSTLTFGHRKSIVPLQCADLAAGALRMQWDKGIFSDNQEVIQHIMGAMGSGGRFSVYSQAAADQIDQILKERGLTI
ncbi:MAG: DUF3800 domain-containing protein [Nitratireductor sp.]|nr:DUF3800 domain-containing protein [Nitratireductor sp.]